MNKLSVIIMTHRSDDRLARAIASASFADEVIVMAQESLLVTVTLDPTVKLIRYPAISDFAAARNHAITQASGDWIFFVDSDEEIAADAVTIIRTAIERQDIAGIEVQRIDIFHGDQLRHGETGNHWLLRIGRKPGFEFKRPVHEVASVAGDTVRLPVVIRHQAHPNVSQFWQAVSRYSKAEAEYRVQQGRPFQWWQMVVFPPAKFVQNYVLKRGFLDGWQGFMYAIMMSLHSFMVRVFWYELTR